MFRTTAFRLIRLALVLSLATACGGPTTPTPTPVPTPAPNSPPVIGAIKIQGTRPKEPPNFADLSEEVEVSAEVTDAESPIGDLQFHWSASVGSFSGTGAKVVWKAPAQPFGSTTVTLNLEVVETCGLLGTPAALENRVSSSETLSLHDSAREVGDMARQFLLDFSDSNIRDVDYIMRNFQPGCYGTAEETAQVADNRLHFRIVTSRVESADVSVRFGGICPFRSKPGDACAHVPVSWSSIFLDDGSPTAVAGVDQVAAVYNRDGQRWRLCDSQFDGHQTGALRAFIR